MSELCLSAVRGVVSTVDISCHMGSRCQLAANSLPGNAAHWQPWRAHVAPAGALPRLCTLTAVSPCSTSKRVETHPISRGRPRCDSPVGRNVLLGQRLLFVQDTMCAGLQTAQCGTDRHSSGAYYCSDAILPREGAGKVSTVTRACPCQPGSTLHLKAPLAACQAGSFMTPQACTVSLAHILFICA
jgi:hypothetical protein